MSQQSDQNKVRSFEPSPGDSMGLSINAQAIDSPNEAPGFVSAEPVSPTGSQLLDARGDKELQMSSVQSLVTLHAKPRSGDKNPKTHFSKLQENLSSGEADDFSLFQQPMDAAAPQEADVNNTFQEIINQSVDQVSPEDDPDFQSIISNRVVQARPSLDANSSKAQAALLSHNSEEQRQDHANKRDPNAHQVANQSEDRSQASSAFHQLALAASGQTMRQESRETSQNQDLGQSHYPRARIDSIKMSKLGSNEASKTARMHAKASSIRTPSNAEKERTAKSSTRQNRPPVNFALPTFSNEVENRTTQQFQNNMSLPIHHDRASQEIAAVQQRNSGVQRLPQKLHINLKNLPSTSGGSSSYSNKDLSERLQGIMRQRKQGHLTSGVSPSLNLGGLQLTTDGYEIDSSNRTGTERDDPMLFSGGLHHSTSIKAAALSGNSGSHMPPPMPANLSQDPYFYLQWRQRNHKSCRSAHPYNQAGYLLAQRNSASPGANARTLRLYQGNKGGGVRRGKSKTGQVNDSASSFSNSSQTTVPVKSLSEVKNPSNLITFRFVNRKVTHLNEIGRFRNLTELDVNGNLLQTEVPELLALNFLKKLNLCGNKIAEMWSLPKTLEILNLSFNCLKKLSVPVIHTLCNLTTLDISNNGVESLDGLESVKRLKRLIARNNQIQSLEPICGLQLLIEIDLENNPIDSPQQVLRAVQNKKDILLLNLRLAPLMVRIQTYDEFVALVEALSEQSKRIDDFKNLLSFLHSGTFYRRKRIYVRIRQQQNSFCAANQRRRFSHFSNDVDSSIGVAHSNNQNNAAPTGTTTQSGTAFSNLQQNLSGGGSGTNPNRRTNERLHGGATGKNQRTNSTGLQPIQKRGRTANSAMNLNNLQQQRSPRYEAIITLYDKLLEDEDKLLLQKKKKEARERKQKRLEDRQANGGQVAGAPQSYLSEEEECGEDDDDLGSIDLDDEDDLDEDLLSQEYLDEEGHSYRDEDSHGEEDFARGVDLDDLQTYHDQHFEGAEPLNASTADFNKEIKQINLQLASEGHFAEAPKGDCGKKAEDAHGSSSGERQSTIQEQWSEETGKRLPTESACTDQIDSQEISVVVPREERSSRYTNRQHHQVGLPLATLTTCKELESSVVHSSQSPGGDGQTSGRLGKSGAGWAQSAMSLQFDHQSQRSKKTIQPSFKLDLAKVQNNQATALSKGGQKHANYSSNRVQQTSQGPDALEEFNRLSKVKLTAGESVRNQHSTQKLISVRMLQNQISLAQTSERIPIKKVCTGNKSPRPNAPNPNLNQSIDHQSQSALDESYSSATHTSKNQRPVPLHFKQVYIPKLALQNIQRQPSDQSRSSNQVKLAHPPGSLGQAPQQSQPEQLLTMPSTSLDKKPVSGPAALQSSAAQPRNLKVLTLSKREESVASNDLSQQQPGAAITTIKQSQITKTLQGKELLQLYESIDHLRKVVSHVKVALGDNLMTDSSILEKLQSMQKEQWHTQERQQMLIEDLSAQVLRLQSSTPKVTNQVSLYSVSIANDTLTLKPTTSSANKSMTALTQGFDPAGNLALKMQRSSGSRLGTQHPEKKSLSDTQAIIDLLNGGSQQSGAAPPSLMLGSQDSKGLAETVRANQQRNIAVGLHVRSKSKQQSSHGRNPSGQQLHSRRDSMGAHPNNSSGLANHGATLELSSKREFLDMCSSPLGLGMILASTRTRQKPGEDNTLERASNQEEDEMVDFGTKIAAVGKGNEGDKQARIVSFFNSEVPPSTQSVEPRSSRLDKDSSELVTPLDSKDEILPQQREQSRGDRDDSSRRVGFFLEKIKERNSSLQERLNLSFKKSARLNQSSISYRPATSLANKKSLKGALIERDCISLTRNFDAIEAEASGCYGQQPPPQSKTPNLDNLASTRHAGDELTGEKSAGRHDLQPRNGGLRPQVVRQIPNQMLTKQQMPKYAYPSETEVTASAVNSTIVTPTNNYTDFLQTGTIESTGTVKRARQNFDQNGRQPAPSKGRIPHQIPALSVLEETDQLRDDLRKHVQLSSTNIADHSDKGPLFNFYKCTEVLHQLSTTSRGNHHSGLGVQSRSVLQRALSRDEGAVGDSHTPLTTKIQQKYSSLLKQKSNNDAQFSNHQPTSTSLLEQAAASTVAFKQNNALVQRASSLEMMPPKLATATPKTNNFLLNAAQQMQQSEGQNYWTGVPSAGDKKAKVTTKANASNPHTSLQVPKNSTLNAQGSTAKQQNQSQVAQSRSVGGTSKPSHSGPVVSNSGYKKVMAPKAAVDKLQLQLKSLVSQIGGNQPSSSGASRAKKTVQTDRARYQSASGGATGISTQHHHSIVASDGGGLRRGSRGVFTATSQPQI